MAGDDKKKGLDGQPKVGPTFNAEVSKNMPVTIQQVLTTPLSQWKDLPQKGGAPTNPDHFQGILDRQAKQTVNIASFQIANELLAMNREKAQNKDYTPKDPTQTPGSPLYGNPEVKKMFDKAVEAAKADPNFGKSSDPNFGKKIVGPLADELRSSYQQQIGPLMDGFKNPPPAAAPTAPAAPQGQAASPPTPQTQTWNI